MTTNLDGKPIRVVPTTGMKAKASGVRGTARVVEGILLPEEPSDVPQGVEFPEPQHLYTVEPDNPADQTKLLSEGEPAPNQPYLFFASELEVLD